MCAFFLMQVGLLVFTRLDLLRMFNIHEIVLVNFLYEVHRAYCKLRCKLYSHGARLSDTKVILAESLPQPVSENLSEYWSEMHAKMLMTNKVLID
jgi:hypothetical protein